MRRGLVAAMALALDLQPLRMARYQTTGIVTPTRLKADLGKLGRIDLELRQGKGEGTIHAHPPCNGGIAFTLGASDFVGAPAP